MDLHLSVILGQSRDASFIQLDEGILNPEPGSDFASPLTLSRALIAAVKSFSALVAVLQKQSVKGKLELLTLDKKPLIRVKRPAPGVAYRFFQPDTPAKAVVDFLNRQCFFRIPTLQLENGTFNLVVGRNGEKFLHEWLSHPAEVGEPLPPGVALNSVSPHFYSTNRPRLVRGRVRCAHRAALPDSWLLVRTVQDGYYNHEGRRVFFSIVDAFLKKDSLVQSFYPARVSMKLNDLNRGFSGCLSGRDITGSGFICSKFGENVFGRIEAPALLFTEIPLEVEA
ncbi:MAG: hypothetical protein GXO70_04765 [Acidobacteria bacterium]|nr:hypothetical protein [Acidobacteriota bacterium]